MSFYLHCYILELFLRVNSDILPSLIWLLRTAYFPRNQILACSYPPNSKTTLPT
ncbi:hypothetical protein QWZ13_01440 [Reinekea marina]|uniref:hypothetical protein n=1 Tax=Reinekea marina TaxID=1310421 RepID=UPI0025B462E9|nr:hypothetical protein [Reinekea marina]MDN3647567.1 hypothetical protein [Reinekea marina]